ncbi:MAG: carbamoyl-phosphate synthase large subunit, partial [Muribaculaceae bacterium]|nr:carbamoyl-phosphate synthase large subunit [Muribaculaceae bacterium]
DEGVKVAEKIGYPVVLRPAFTLGGTGGGFADNEDELRELMRNALTLSPVHQVLVEKSIKGYKEIEYEVMRDSNDTAITICNMENVDPVGVHTGDSVVVAPSQTLTNKEYQLLRDSALRLIRALEIEGGCNVQFALDPLSFNYYIIEVNPRVSRSSALASKATGYPIARVSAKIAVGMTLDEIQIANTPASFEPALDYVVTKIARFPFDKFSEASNLLGTQMKATGEIMSVGRTFEESLLKGIRSLETGVDHLYSKKFEYMPTEEILQYIKDGRDDRLLAIAQLLRRKVALWHIYEKTGIDLFFLEKLNNIIKMEWEIQDADTLDAGLLREAKRMGFSDRYIAKLRNRTEADIREMRESLGITPVYKMIDTCSGEFDSYVPYFYSTYEEENESEVSDRRKILVLGSGPIRIGQGVEFDYSTVHAIQTIREQGYEAIIINNNPETVSTDYSISDKLYFEPLTVEDVMNVVRLEKPDGVIVTLGGQTAINLAAPLAELGVPIIGTGLEAIDRAEDRKHFERIMRETGIPQPDAEAVTDIESGVKAAERIGYPVLVRPSFVLGGRAMQIVGNEQALRHYLQNAVDISDHSPVLVDKYIMGKELEVDAICDGKDVLIPGIMEHVEKTGIHSGDSISVYPTFSVSENVRQTIVDYTVRLGKAIGIVGLYNIQFIVDKDENVYVIEVNPRSSRTVPFLSKSTGVPMAKIASKVMLGESLKSQGYDMTLYPDRKRWFVKTPAFSFSKIKGVDSYLSPEMKSTGEAIGYDDMLTRALYKSLQASGMQVLNYGTLLVTVSNDDKEKALPLIRRFYDLGFNVEATRGTAKYLKDHGIRCRTLGKFSEGSNDIERSLRQGHVSYVINTIDVNQHNTRLDGYDIRRIAIENNVTIFTALETVRVLLDVLEEITMGVSTIDAEYGRKGNGMISR